MHHARLLEVHWPCINRTMLVTSNVGEPSQRLWWHDPCHQAHPAALLSLLQHPRSSKAIVNSTCQAVHQPRHHQSWCMAELLQMRAVPLTRCAGFYQGHWCFHAAGRASHYQPSISVGSNRTPCGCWVLAGLLVGLDWALIKHEGPHLQPSMKYRIPSMHLSTNATGMIIIGSGAS